MNRKLKRGLSLLLSLVMVLSLLPATALAAISPVPDGENEDPRYTVEFYAGSGMDGTPYETQIVKAGETLVRPETPEILDEYDEFAGWYIGGTEGTDGVWTGGTEVQFGLVGADWLSTNATNGVIQVHARFINAIHVTFYDCQPNTKTDEGGNYVEPAIVTTRSMTGGPIDLNSVTAEPWESNMVFDKWVDQNGNAVSTPYTATEDTSLYATFVSGYSLVFNANGDGATNTATQYLKEGENTTTPATPARPGYTFQGWYTEPGGGTQFTFGSALTKDTTVYAHWTAATANYTVVFWQQKVSDDKNAADENKTYDYVSSEVRSATTGSAVSATTEDTGKTYDGFHYSRSDTNVVVEPDGSTILNVYYDRNLITMTFETAYSYNRVSGNLNTNNIYYYYYNDKYYNAYYDSSWGWYSFYGSGNNDYRTNINQSDLYTRTATSTNTYTGLYGQTLTQNGYTWPAGSWQYTNAEGTVMTMTFLNTFILTPASAMSVTFGQNNTPDATPVHFYKENENGNWVEANTVNGSGTDFKISDKYTGYYAYQYSTNGSNWTTLGTPDVETGYYMTVSSYDNLYIRYKRNTYNLDFMNGTEKVRSDSLLYGAALNTVTAPSGENLTYPGASGDAAKHYTFLGWYTAPVGGEQLDFATITETMPANSLVAYAQWEAEKETVTYDANGGTFTDAQGNKSNTVEVTADYGEKLSNVPTPYNEGYTFLGWVDEDGNAWNFETAVTENVTLYAQWHTDHVLNIVYNVDNDFTQVSDTNKYDDGATAIVKPFGTSGKRFVGWSLGEFKNDYTTLYQPGDEIEVSSTTDKDDGNADYTITLYAVFAEPITTSITFNANGGQFSDEQSIKTELGLDNNSDIDLDTIEKPTRTGYQFLGWSYQQNGTAITTKEGAEIFVDNTSENILYAVWEVNTYTLTYSWSGLPASGTGLYDQEGNDVTSTIEEPDPITTTYGSAYTIDTSWPTKVVYTHDQYGNKNGSYTLSAWSDPYNGIMGAANATITATWTAATVTVPTWTITYKWSGDVPEGAYAKTLPTDSTTYVNNQPYTVDTTFTNGYTVTTYDQYGNANGKYTFSGWDRQDGMITSDLTISGTWSYETTTVETHNVTYSWTGLPENETLYDAAGNVTVPTIPDSITGLVKNQTYSIDTSMPGTVVYTHDQYGNTNGSYTLSAWSDPNNGTMGEADVTVTATWTAAAVTVPTWTITYSWSGSVPEGAYAKTLPTDSTTYVNNQPYTVDTTFTNGYTVTTYDQYENVNGKYTFSGWDHQDGTITGDLTISGTWSYEATTVATHNVTYSWTGLPDETLYDAAGTETVPTKPASITGLVKSQPYSIDTSMPGTVVYTHDQYGNTNGSYTLGNWNDPNNGTMGEADVTVTAQWTQEIIPVSTWTVTYKDGRDENDEEIFADQTYSNLINGCATPAFNGTPSREGYQFRGWTPTVANTVTEDAVYTATWAFELPEQPPMTIKAVYQIEHYKENESGGYDLADTTFPAGSETVGAIVTAKDSDYKTYEGFTPDPYADGAVLSAEVITPVVDEESKQITAITTLKLYYSIDKKGDPDDPENKGDEIPDKYQVKVTFEVENGAWDDETTDDVIEYVTLTDDEGNWSENGSYRLTASDVPAVGNEPDEGYQEGDWDTNPVDAVVRGETTYTYTYEDGMRPIDPSSKKVAYQIEHYKENSAGGYDLEETVIPAGVAAVGETVTVKESDYKTYDGYVLDTTVADTVTSAEVITPVVDEELQKITEITTLKLYYSIDEKGDPDDPENKGDEIPDKYQVKVTFEVENGAWDDETTDDVIEYVTLTDNKGNWSENGSYTLTSSDVPSVGNEPDEGYQEGDWDTNPVDAVVRGETTYTYTYEDGMRPIDPSSKKVAYQIEHYKENSAGGYDLEETVIPAGVAAVGETVTVKESDYKTYDGYVLDTTVADTVTSAEVITPVVDEELQKITEITTLKLYYSIDEKGDPDDPENKGDEIPDKYQVKVTFEVENGAWDDETTDDVIEYVTLTDDEGNWSENGSYTLTASDVPAVGNEPDEGYQEGDWNTNPHGKTIYNKETYTYTYTVIDVPSLSVSKTLSKVNGRAYRGNDVDVGDTLTYTITVKNNGNVTLNGINVTDELPSGLRTSDKTSWTILSLEPGESEEFTMDAVVRAVAEGEKLTNTASAKSDDGTAGSGSVTVQVDDVTPVTPSRPSKPTTPSIPEPPVEEDPTVTVRGLNTVDHVAYVIGVGDGKVAPVGTITRAEIANIYFRLMTDEFRNDNWSTDNRFKDVPDDAWYTMAVLTLDEAGVITDSDDGNFRPGDPITRAELSVMAAQFCTITGEIPATSFKDIPDDYWAADEIALIEFAGWIEGYAGYFRPDDNLTRAEAMTIVNRMLQRGAEDENMLRDMITWVDNDDPEVWYYDAIQEATNSHDYTRTTKLLTGENFRGEKWTELLKATDWAALEKAWIEANSK